MTLAQVKVYAQALSELEAERLRMASIALRAGMADEKGWRAWLKTLDSGVMRNAN